MNHDANTYSKHRPLYPESVFQDFLGPKIKERSQPLEILDVACGSGQSTLSLSKLLSLPGIARITACDPDPEMIFKARQLHADLADWQIAPAESLPFPDASFDRVLILSAYHWFDRAKADAEILRVLRPGGRLLIAEYQFPVSLHQPELNAWIRRSFNETWKFPDQKPRGRLRDFTASLLTHPRVRNFRWDRLQMHRHMTAPELAGLLFSQARFIAHLNEITTDSARLAYQEQVESRIAELMPIEGAPFDFRLTRVLAHLG